VMADIGVVVDAQLQDRPTGDGEDGRDSAHGEARSWLLRDGSGASFGWNAHDFNPRSHQGTDGRVGFRRIGHQQSDC
jgi:hypothetical protein